MPGPHHPANRNRTRSEADRRDDAMCMTAVQDVAEFDDPPRRESASQVQPGAPALQMEGQRQGSEYRQKRIMSGMRNAGLPSGLKPEEYRSGCKRGRRTGNEPRCQRPERPSKDRIGQMAVDVINLRDQHDTRAERR